MIMEQLQVKVFASLQSDSPMLVRIVNVNPSVSVPYTSMMENFRFLFGNNCKVEFCFI